MWIRRHGKEDIGKLGKVYGLAGSRDLRARTREGKQRSLQYKFPPPDGLLEKKKRMGFISPETGQTFPAGASTRHGPTCAPELI